MKKTNVFSCLIIENVNYCVVTLGHFEVCPFVCITDLIHTGQWLIHWLWDFTGSISLDFNLIWTGKEHILICIPRRSEVAKPLLCLFITFKLTTHPLIGFLSSDLKLPGKWTKFKFCVYYQLMQKPHGYQLIWFFLAQYYYNFC